LLPFRACVMASSGSGFQTRTGSSRGVFKKNGETMAVVHPTMVKSYAANEAAGNVTALSTMKASFKDPTEKQPLSKYHPNALRSRLAVKFENEAKPFTRFCQVRNEHTYNFLSGSTEAGYEPYRTTSQNYYNVDTGALAVGESNQGIVSEKSKWIHKKQTR